jgi:hypothetical protein
MAQFSAESRYAVTTGPSNDVDAYSAQFAGGGHVVVWTAAGSDPTQARSFAQVYDAQGNATGGAIQLFTDPLFTTQGADVGGVATLADGSFVVLARSEKLYENHSPPDWEFYQERLGADGTVLSGPAYVATIGSYDYPQASSGPVFASPDGTSYYFEIDTTIRFTNVGGTHTLLKHYAPGGGVAGMDISDGSISYDVPDAAVLAGGNVLSVAAEGRYGQWVVISAYDAAGNQVGTATIGQSNIGAVNDYAPEVAALANGNALLVSRHSEYDPNAQTQVPPQWQVHVLDANGHVISDAHVLSAVASGTSAVHVESLFGGGALAWWASDSSYFAQALDANGDASGDVVAIGTSVTSVTGTRDGGFLVESSINGDIYEQKFDVAGSPTAHIDVNGDGGLIPAGNFAITGGAGLDTISFGSAHTAYAVSPTSISGPEGSDTLAGIERVRFSDGYAVAFDVNGDAGQAYRLYQAAFDRAPDLPGLGFHINDLDHGVALATVAQHFIESPEFLATYGGVDNAQFITLLYRNVLNREPEQAGLQFHLDEFAHGETRAGMLTHFSESPENQALVIGQIGNGMLYVPLA